MSLRLIEIFTESGHADSVAAAAEQCGAVDIIIGRQTEDGRQMVRVLLSNSAQQGFIDQVQSLLGAHNNWRLVILPVEGALPPPRQAEPEAEAETSWLPPSRSASREELYADVKAGTRLDRAFVVLTLLSTAVAAIGMLTDNVAVIIGAMVIAPLLGPNLAFAFGTAMGDRQLIRQASITNAVGLMLTILVSVIIGAIWDYTLMTNEFLSRTSVSYAAVALALASGAAGVLSLTTGVSSALVGVMVAVALLPPAAAMGMAAGAGQWVYAAGAALLLAINLVCVNISAQLVFAVKGLGPRTFSAKAGARKYVWRALVISGLVLIGLVAVIWWRGNS